jgi:multidrug efflux pump subunit AcrA (membrane-fusion protein)
MIARRLLAVFVLLSIVLLPVLSACNLPSKGSQATEVSATASPGASSPDSVSAEGVVTPLRKADLSFEGSGRVDRILVSEGDQVIAGQELAVLATTDLEQGALQAQARLESAQAQLAKAQAGARPEEIDAAKAGALAAQAGARAASGAVAIAQGKLAGAEASLKAAQDSITVASSQLASARASYQAAEAAYKKLKAQPTALDIQIAEKQVEAAKNALYDTQLMYHVGQAYKGEAEQGEVRVELAELNLAKVKAGARPEDIAEAKGRMDQASANIKVAQARVAKAKAQAAQAQAGVQAAQGGVMQAQAQAEKAEAQSSQAQAQLDLAAAGSRAEDIAAAQAGVKQAEASLADAKNALEDALLKAPFDGTVGAILVDEGDLVAPQLAAVQLGDLSQLRVETKDLSEMDVDMVQVGQSATITVDALGGKELPATVASISPVGTEERGDTVYRVALDLEPGTEAGLRWGMSTLVEIKTGSETSPAAEGTPVVSGDAVVSAQAVIVPQQSAELSFKSSGRVQEILVSEGDLVTAGQELVKQETRNQEQIVLQAEAGLAQAEANLAKTKAGARPEEVASAEAAVDIAKADVRAAEAAVVVAEGQLAVAQAEAEAAKADKDMAEGQVAVMQGARSAAQARLDKAKNGPTALDLQLAERQVDLAAAGLNMVDLMKDIAEGYLRGLVAELQAQVDIAKLQLEQAQAGTLAEDLVAAQAQATQASSDVQAAQAQFSQAQAQVLVEQAAVQTAEAELAQAKAQVDVAGAQVQQAQAQLDILKAGSRQEDIAAAEANVAEATAGLAAAKNLLDDATLKALFDGTVGAVLVDEGELAQPGYAAVTLGDLSLFRAETEDLSEVDVSRVQVGQRVAVTVDALEGRVIPGTVSRIAPVATERRGDTVYKVSVDLDATSNEKLRWGMSAYVEIDTASQAAATVTKVAKTGVPAGAMPATATAAGEPTPIPVPRSAPASSARWLST